MDKKELKTAYKERHIMGGVYAIQNKENGKMLVCTASDLSGIKNRFEFFQKFGGSALHGKLQKDIKQFGKNAFIFKTLEELKKKDTQTSAEFRADLETLKDIWLEKLDADILY